MKQLIRLTESALHNLIAEATQEILSEMDWRTWGSAAQQSFDRGNEYDQEAKRQLQDKWYDKFRFWDPHNKKAYKRKGYKNAIAKRDKEYARGEEFRKKAEAEANKSLGYKDKQGFNYNITTTPTTDHAYGAKKFFIQGSGTQHYKDGRYKDDPYNSLSYTNQYDSFHDPDKIQNISWANRNYNYSKNRLKNLSSNGISYGSSWAEPNMSKSELDKEMQYHKNNMATTTAKNRATKGNNALRNFAQNKSYYKDGQWHEGE